MQEVELTHFHFCAGLGGGAKGFNKARPIVGSLRGKWRCLGGVDVSAPAMRDFEKLTGVAGTVMDLFTREQFIAFHGKEPPAGWKEATPVDIQRAANFERPAACFISSPCKGASGLLSEHLSKTPKYQALNELTLRCVWLMCEAWRNDPVDLIVFENVPRLAVRGRHLLDQIGQILRHYGYAVAETTHDCGELGGLAQSRKRFLLVARHIDKVPPFLYEPEKKRLQSVGTVLSRMPLPGAIQGGPMHRVPRLAWATWVRLAFVEAGKDWRSLNRLAVEDGYLRDYLIVPEYRSGFLGVNRWDEHMGTVAGRSGPTNGDFSVADPRYKNANDYMQYGVVNWDGSMGAITSQRSPGQGVFSVADPRFAEVHHNNVYRVVSMDSAAGTVTGGHGPSSGGQAVADPRMPHSEGRHQNMFRVVPWSEASKTIIGKQQVGSGAGVVADPRGGPDPSLLHGKYHVTPWGEPSRTVIGGAANGASVVADPRPGWERHSGNLALMDWAEPSHTVIAGGKGVQGGWLSVADPRPNMNRVRGDNYLTGGHYGVVGWEASCGAVSAAACHDNGRWSIADPRMPEAKEKLVAVIRSMDGTWHRPFTTLELSAIQGLIEPEEYLELDGLNDGEWRERIGNAVPPPAAQAIAEVMGRTLLMAMSGETMGISKTPIWVQPVAIALALAQTE